MAARDPYEWMRDLPQRPVRTTEDPLCARCRQAKVPPGTLTVSTRMYELVDAVVQAAIALGNAQNPESIMHLGDEQSFLNACLDSLYHRIEKIEKAAHVERDTTIRF